MDDGFEFIDEASVPDDESVGASLLAETDVVALPTPTAVPTTAALPAPVLTPEPTIKESVSSRASAPAASTSTRTKNDTRKFEWWGQPLPREEVVRRRREAARLAAVRGPRVALRV